VFTYPRISAGSWRSPGPQTIGSQSETADPSKVGIGENPNRIGLPWLEALRPGLAESRPGPALSVTHTPRRLQILRPPPEIDIGHLVHQLDPQNSEKIADAVAGLRRTLPAREKPAPTPLYGATVIERLASLDKQCAAIVSKFQSIAGPKCRGEERFRLELTLNCASAPLQQIQVDHGLYPQDPQ
jgi:hypothetical protein